MLASEHVETDIAPQPSEETPKLDPSVEISPDAGGKGYTFGDTGLWVGGYVNIVAEAPEQGPVSGGFDDLGILIRYEPTARLAFFGEAELEDLLVIEEHKDPETGHDIFSIQRLFIDYSLRPNLTARFGKFLTPFGLWNPMRRAPLTWTVERPVVTETAFPVHTTGPALLYQTTAHAWTLDAFLYGQAQDELVRRDDDKSASAMVGSRFAAAHSLGEGFAGIGLNVATFEDRDSDIWETTVGLDFELELSPHEIMMEADILQRNGPNEWGLYLQDVVPLFGDLYGVVRYEHFDLPEDDDIDGWLLGLAWRPRPNIVLKLNYQLTDQQSDALPRGALLGLAISF